MDSQGEITWKSESEAFGKTILAKDNQVVMNLRFPGQYYDSETEIHYNYFRDYDPVSGRYQQRDPIGLLGGLNFYSYSLNPMQSMDPLGLYRMLVDWLNQPGIREAYNNECTKFENSRAQPHSDWEFTEWNVVYSPEWMIWARSKSVRAMCKDQYGKEKNVQAKYFQIGFVCINEICLGQSDNYSYESQHPVDSLIDIAESHFRAKKCGSKSNFECFMEYEITPALGNQLCKEGSK